MTMIHFTQTKLNQINKEGVLKPDENGYYTVPLGAVNCYNAAGEFYSSEGIENLFSQSSSLMRRIKNGNLYGELGHPKKLPNMSNFEFYQRARTIEETNVCMHISEVWLDYDYGKKVNSSLPNIIGIFGKVKPAGPHTNVLKEDLDNKKANVCFSIRCLTSVEVKNGVTVKKIEEIITWDRVIEPGISIANKWDAPSLEDLVDNRFTKKQIITYSQEMLKESVTFESDRLALSELINRLDRENRVIESNRLLRW
jgi:hypothetical protein